MVGWEGEKPKGLSRRTERYWQMTRQKKWTKEGWRGERGRANMKGPLLHGTEQERVEKLP